MQTCMCVCVCTHVREREREKIAVIKANVAPEDARKDKSHMFMTSPQATSTVTCARNLDLCDVHRYDVYALKSMDHG